MLLFLIVLKLKVLIYVYQIFSLTAIVAVHVYF